MQIWSTIMGLRQTIIDKPMVGIAVGTVCLALGIAAIGFNFVGGHPSNNPDSFRKAFYSDDDGKTWFIDDADKLPPFDHNGHPAYRAGVFRCQDGHVFVAYLQRLPDALRAKLASSPVRDSHGGADAAPRIGPETAFEARKPGDTAWIEPRGSTALAYRRLMIPTCADPSANVVAVLPTDPDSGATK